MDETDRSEQAEWLEMAPLLHDQVAPIVARLRRVDADGKPTAGLEDYAEAARILPPILSAMKKLPQPRGKDLRESKRAYQAGINAFIKASECGVNLSAQASEGQLANLVYFLGLGTDLLEQAAVLLAAYRQ